MSVFDIPQETFNAHLDEVDSCVRFMDEYRGAKGQLFAILDWGSENQYAVGVCREFLNLRIDFDRSLVNGLYLSTVACFEQFLRELLSALIVNKAGELTEFEEIDEKLRKRHIKETGKLMSRVLDPPHHLAKLDYYQICRRLGGCYPGSKSFELVTESLCLDSNIVELGIFFETAQAFDLELDWNVLGGFAPISTALNLTGSAERIGKSLREYIFEMRRIRNRLSHAGTVASDLTFVELKEQTAVLRGVAAALCKAVAG